MALVSNAVVDPEVVGPQLTLVEHVVVMEVRGGQILFEIERDHVHSIFASILDLRRTKDTHLSTPAIYGGFLTVSLNLEASLRFLLKMTMMMLIIIILTYESDK